MLNYQEEQEIKDPGGEYNFRMATVVSATESTAKVKFDGDDTSSAKEFKRLCGVSVSAGDRVLCAKISGTYIVLGTVKN